MDEKLIEYVKWIKNVEEKNRYAQRTRYMGEE